MISSFFYELLDNPFYRSVIAFCAVYIVYELLIGSQKIQYRYANQSKPIPYKRFRMYGRMMISNAPSRKERLYYERMNIITMLFNIVFLLFFAYTMFINILR